MIYLFPRFLVYKTYSKLSLCEIAEKFGSPLTGVFELAIHITIPASLACSPNLVKCIQCARGSPC